MERPQPAEIEIKVVTPRRPAASPATENGRRFDDKRPFKKWRTWLVWCIVLINVVVFVVTMYEHDCPKNSDKCIARFLGRFAFQPFKENPLLGPSSTMLDKMGALEVKKMIHGHHQAWRLLSCMWLHAGVFHVLANMLSLVFIGIRLEQEFGFVRIGLVYVISGFGGSMLSTLFINDGISVGASGALFGLLGSMLSELISNWTIYANKFAALLTLIFIILINLAVGVLPHVDNFAHVGGFLSGFLLGFVFLIRPQFKWVKQRNATPGHIRNPVRSKYKTYQYILWVISLILLIVWFTLGLVYLLRGVNLNEYCTWCHYMSCVPTSKWKCQQRQIECLTNQLGNQLNVTCSSNGNTRTYSLANNNTSSRIQQLCTELCS